MSDDQQKVEQAADQEPLLPQGGAAPEIPKTRRSFSQARRELTEEELNTPGVSKMLLDELERLDRDNTSLSEYRALYHKTDKECGILKEKNSRRIASDVVFGVCMTIGGGLFWHATQADSYVLLGAGTILIAMGIVAKAIKQ